MRIRYLTGLTQISTSTVLLLPDQDNFPDDSCGLGGEAIEIDAGRKAIAVVIPSIPDDAVCAGGLRARNQGSDERTGGIVDFKLDRR